MSIARRAAKRDAAEPAIVSALEALGCVVWRVSGTGLTDLVVFHKRRMPLHPLAETVARQRSIFVADVKGPKEKATPAQEERWTELTNLGFSVFILRTPEDAQKMLNNALQPWEPTPPRIGKDGRLVLADLKGNARMVEVARRMRAKEPVYGNNYTPPRSTPVDAAKEAEATFAPPPDDGHQLCAHDGCPRLVIGSDLCMVHDPSWP